jgi:hypothetical protein
MSIPATVNNMEKYEYLNPIAVSPATMTQCSATPGDYYFMKPDDCLKDDEGYDMVLCKVSSTFVDVDEWDDFRSHIDEYFETRL